MFVAMCLALDPLSVAVAAAGPASPAARTSLLPFVAAASSPTLVAPDTSSKAALGERLGKLPLYFIENRGQVDSRVAYYVSGSETSVYFGAEGVTYALSERPASATAAEEGAGRGEAAERQRWALKLDFLNANPNVRPTGDGPTTAVVSYFKGPRESWKTGLPTYAGVVYRELWPGIDLEYSGTGGQLKYTFVVQPGADPGRIRLAYRGATALDVGEDGRLRVTTPARRFDEERPIAFQEIDGRQVPVEASYALQGVSATDGSRFGFRLGAYDRAKPLVLDPVQLVYCGYIGGVGVDEAYDVAIDGSGNAYVTGRTTSLTGAGGFPATAGSWDSSYNGVSDFDAFVAKVNAAGTALVYCGYIGGMSADEGRGIAVDSLGNAYVTGFTNSPAGFPVTTSWDATFAGGGEAFVAKIDAGGTSLVYCGYIGGALVDYGQGVAVDTSGSAYVVGFTSSVTTGPGSGRFPVTPSWPYQSNNGGAYDAFVAKISSNGLTLVYCGYIGGLDVDEGRGIAVDAAGSAYVVGYTAGMGFPTTIGPDTTYNGGTDAFVAKINPGGTALLYSGYIGGASEEAGEGIAVDVAGNAYVIGHTRSSEGSFVPAGALDATHNGDYDVFVAKIAASGTSRLYSGYIGGSGADFAGGIVLDAFGNAYVTGYTSSTESTFPVVSWTDPTANGGFDAFAGKIDASGNLVYSGFIGGSSTDNATGVAVDASGSAYVVGFTSSDGTTFPVVAGSWATAHNGGNDAFLAKIGEAAATVDLGLTKVDDIDPVGLGALLTYTLTVTNGSASTATGVTLEDTLPSSLSFQSAGPASCPYDSVARKVRCNLGSIGPSSSVTVSVKVRPQAVGTFVNSAIVSGSEPDPNVLNNSRTEDTTVTVFTTDVRFFTVTSTNGKNVLEWVNPTIAAVPDYASTVIRFSTAGFPADANDGAPLPQPCPQPGAGQKVRCEHAGSNGTTYYYAAFVDRSSSPDSAGRFNKGRPFDTTHDVKWAFNTGATAVSPPTVGGVGVVAPSNDRVLYAMERGAIGGEWPAAWWPIELTGLVQSRSPVVPVPAGTPPASVVNPVVFLGSQDGRVSAVDATGGSNGAGVVWAAPVASMVQAAPAGIFMDFGGAFDYVLVGTRDSSVSNALVALRPSDGYVIGRYQDTGDGHGAIGIVNGMAAVDYARRRVYFTSHERLPVGNTLWCLELKGSAPYLEYKWARQLGDIDSSPVVRNDRVYVGSALDGGKVFSIDAVTGDSGLDRVFPHGDGQVKGFIFPDRSTDDIYFATERFVWGARDDGSDPMSDVFGGPISLGEGVKPSAVLFVPGTSYLYVGGTGDNLYEINLATGPGVNVLPLANGLGTVGAPSFDRGHDLVHVGTEAGTFFAVHAPFGGWAGGMCVARCAGQPDGQPCTCSGANPCVDSCVSGLCSPGGGC